MREELRVVGKNISEHPYEGISLGHHTYKIRIAVRSKGKGKSGGMRIVSYVLTEEKEVYLLTIYDNSEVETLDDKTLNSLITNING